MKHCDGCDGCPVDDEVVKMAEKYKNVEGGIISALHEVQDKYGYIPEQVQKYLSKELNVPLSDIYGIITFYSRFSLMPKGKYNIQVCLGTACHVNGSQEILERFKTKLGIKEGQVTPDNKFSLETVRCVGACGLAPTVVVNSEVYGRVTVDMVDDILSKYKD